MTCYAVIDTNVLVSALLTSHDDAATVQVVQKLLSGDIIPVYSTEIAKEYTEVLNRKKFGFSPELVEGLLSAFFYYGIRIEPMPSGVILPDMKDLPFFEVVLEKKDNKTYLVTGNLKHFPKEPFIVTARQFLDILDNKTEELC